MTGPERASSHPLLASSASAAVLVDDPHFDTVLERDIPSVGLLRFEEAAAGTVNAKGERRRSAWRAYWHTDPDGKRRRLTSVTTLLNAILPAGGLVQWAEAAGAEGAIEAVRRGLLDPRFDGAVDMAADVVRANRLGADAARDKATTRGTDTHGMLEAFLLKGEVPSILTHQPYARALSGWLLKADPQPELIEHIVCDPDAGYAGRLDLVARIDGRRTLVDLKTSAKGYAYPKGHLQLGLLARAMLVCGDGEVEGRMLVVLCEDGSFAEVEGVASADLVGAACEYAGLLRPVTGVCEKANRLAREAVRLAA